MTVPDESVKMDALNVILITRSIYDLINRALLCEYRFLITSEQLLKTA